LVLVLAALWWLTYIYFDPRFDREPWRQVGDYLTAQSSQGDVLVLEPDYDYKAVSYYYLGYLPLPTFLMGAPYSEEEAAEVLNHARVNQPGHVWLVTRHDDVDIGANGLLGQQLDKTMHLAATTQLNLLEIREYVPK
jgi:hypothetical protein